MLIYAFAKWKEMQMKQAKNFTNQGIIRTHSLTDIKRQWRFAGIFKHISDERFPIHRILLVK